MIMSNGDRVAGSPLLMIMERAVRLRRPHPFRTWEHSSVTRRAFAYGVALLGPAAMAAALRPVADDGQATNAAFAFLLVVLCAAALGGLRPGVVASVAAFLAFDLGFVEPHGRLSVAVRSDGGVLAGFLVTAVVVAVLVARLAERRAHAEEQADEARLLYELSVSVAHAEDPAAEVAAIVAFAAHELGADTVVVGTSKGTLHEGGLGAGAAALLTGRDPRVATATAGLADGTLVTVAATPATAFDERRRALLGAVAGRVAVVVDRGRLREERHRAELLEATERSRSALLASVSHDLRTPLAAIKASASALADTRVTERDREELRASIGVEVDRLDRMVRNLLDLGRIEGGRLVARPEPVPVDELVGSVLARLRPRLTERRLELDVPADLPAAWVDPVQGEQALGNLVENVVAHTPLNAGLIVRATRRGDRVVVRVADEGPGIPEALRAKLFQRFTKGGAGGSGLGLAIARAYAEANGGTLDAVAAECGAAFELALPVAREAAP
jgi:two-component system sensor histidine kinase KdpD